MKIKHNLLIILISVFTMHVAQAQETELKIGDSVSPFSAKNDKGEVWESKEFLGKKNVVVYFYPAAMTGGCTKQACAYRDAKDDLSGLDAEVVGVSGDEVMNLGLFKRAHDLNFTLLSDPDGKIATEFGVPLKAGVKSIEREIDGKPFTLSRGVTTARWTFIIDKKGEIVYKSTQVNAAEDSNAVIEVLETLSH